MPVSGAANCDTLRSNFARQTPVFDETFLNDYISDMVNEPFIGRHQTETWRDGAASRFFDKIHVQQPNYLDPWGRRGSTGVGIYGDSVTSGADCTTGLCNPPRTLVGYGTTRDSYFMENRLLQSQPFCLDDLRNIPHVGKQVSEIYKVLRQMPMAFVGDYLRTRLFAYHDTVQICGSAFGTYTPTAATCDPALSTVQLNGADALPTSELTWNILQYYTQLVGMKGYDKQSGLAAGMRNLLTHSRTYHKLVGMNPEIRSQLHLVGVKDVSPLYKMGTGINADPFGPIAPTFDEKQVRFQHAGNGMLIRVLPYLNDPATSGEKPILNNGWFNARYGLSYILHPQASTLLTPQPKKIHEMVPSVNSAMWGSWDFINNKGIIQWTQSDGNTCQQNNDLQWWFYWLCYLEAGLKYEQRDLVLPILHLIDGAGKDCVVDSPVCGDAPEYDSEYSDAVVGYLEC